MVQPTTVTLVPTHNLIPTTNTRASSPGRATKHVPLGPLGGRFPHLAAKQKMLQHPSGRINVDPPVHPQA